MAGQRKAKQKGIELMSYGRNKKDASENEPKDCVICLDKIQIQGIIICRHWFCFVCIYEWSKVRLVF